MKGEKTKYRLAAAMKECMKTTPVDAITVRQITERCGVTRQTFYRNFLDKYDLINWYFDKLLARSFEHMGRGTTVLVSLEKKFTYIQEMYCQGSITMTVKWVLGGMDLTPSQFAGLLVRAMPAALRDLFLELHLLS